MEKQISKQASLFMWILVSVLLSQNFVIPVMSIAFEDQKTYYPPDPHAGSPPGGSHHHTPSHGPPSQGTPPRGGNCSPTPSTGHGGGSHGTPPSHGGGGSHDPATPTTPPSGGGGGSYHSPPSGGSGTPPVIVSPPVGITPPVTISPPTTPIGTPTIPSPPFVFDPNTPFNGTCIFWSSHPAVIWGLVGFGGNLGGAFGTINFPVFTPNLSLLAALTNTLTNGYGALYREGTASYLNSIANHRFPYTTSHVRNSFVNALGSNRAAAAQAQLFKMANEGRVKRRA